MAESRPYLTGCVAVKSFLLHQISNKKTAAGRLPFCLSVLLQVFLLLAAIISRLCQPAHSAAFDDGALHQRQRIARGLRTVILRSIPFYPVYDRKLHAPRAV